MFTRITGLFLALLESYFFIVVIALIAGLLFSQTFVLLNPYTTLFLQIIFFLTSLKLDPKEMLKEAHDIKMIVLSTVFMLLALPTITYLVVSVIAPPLAIPLMLLAAMPSGMTSPLLAEVVGGKQSLALILTISTSLLAPFTIPFVIQLFAGTAVTVSAVTMFTTLFMVIVIPFAIAQIVRHFLHRHITATFFTFKPISIVLLGLLIAGAVAKQAPFIMSTLGVVTVFHLLALSIFIGLLLLVGYYIAFWRNCSDRLTVSVCLTFLNFTLAIYLASSFFPDPSVLTLSVLVIFPWALALLPYKYIVRKWVCPI